MTQITREHLGMDATDHDVAQFNKAVRLIADRDFDGDLEAAEDWLWGNGDYMRRMPDELLDDAS